MRKFSVFLYLLVILSLSGCSFANSISTNVNKIEDTIVSPTMAEKTSNIQSDQNSPTTTVTETIEATSTLTPVSNIGSIPPVNPTQEVAQAVGPDNFPPNIDPLSGLPVDDPSMLNYPPALLSITFWPVSAREKQGGFSFTPIVFELYIGEGSSRALGIFHGNYPSSTTSENTLVGPLRSGRLPYEDLRNLYSGFLVMASGYSGVLNNLDQYHNYYGTDEGDINSALVNINAIKGIAQDSNSLPTDSLSGNEFDPALPAGGVDAHDLWYIYNSLDIVDWKYDPTNGSYNRYQDNADGVNYIEAKDSVNGDPLAYENIIVLVANHRMCNEYAFAVDLMYIDKMPAYLFRDGQMYPIFWTTKNEDYENTTGRVRPIRFIDANGNPFPLKPGQTWIHLSPRGTSVWESTNSNVYFDLLNKTQPGSGNWVTRFFASNMVFDSAVCDSLH
jgi:hypothetical protein